MKTTIALTLTMAMFATASFAGEFKNQLSLKKVMISSKYKGKNLFWRHTERCQEGFTGTYDQGTVVLTALASGGEGAIKHTLVYMLGNGYETKEMRVKQVSVKKKGQRETFRINLPALRDNVPYLNQVVSLISEDEKGNVARTSMNFNVSRPVILTPTTGDKAKTLNCFERYVGTESVAGVLSNGSTNVSTLDIKQGVQRLWESRQGHQWGVFLTPQLNVPFFSLALSLNYQYFKETSKQTIETIEVTAAYNLNPGDYLQIYTQPTRYLSAYDATTVDYCGKMERKEAAYMFQWWGYAYHVRPVDPFVNNGRVDLSTVGAMPMNTCPQEWTQSELGGNFLGFNQ
jgi:hypothetical protein